jgi:hypothetical protein
MFEPQLDRFTAEQATALLEGNTQIPFRDLINRTLPPYLWDYLNIILNPSLGGVSRIGDLDLDFNNPQVVANLEQRLMDGLVLNGQALTQLLLQALATRMSFIFDPAQAITKMIFARQTSLAVPSGDIRTALDALLKVINHWNPRTIKAAAVIQEYLAQQTALAISEEELTRLLHSAIEKDAASNPFPLIETNILILKELIAPIREFKDGESTDWTESLSLLLTNFGLTAWIPALQVERELREKPLDLDAILAALTRLKLYRERGVLKVEKEELAVVEEEVAGFTSFIGGVS